VALPERADVIVADIGGTLPWFQQHIPAMLDARRRLLVSGGRLFPQRDIVWMVVADVPDLYRRQTAPWKENEFGLNMDAAHRIVVNTFTKGQLAPDQMLTVPQPWATVDYGTVEDTNVQARVCAGVIHRGTGYGVIAGFDRTVSDGERLSNAPDADPAIKPERIYGTMFFPWPAPIALDEGDIVEVEIDARLIGAEYIWRWKTAVLQRGSSSSLKASFDQSTFFGAPLSPARLQKRAAAYTPVLTPKGRMARLVLESMSRGLTLGEIAHRVFTDFPLLCPRQEDALAYVADFSEEFG
jgi:protein arginine N-methyltransferase 1